MSLQTRDFEGYNGVRLTADVGGADVQGLLGASEVGPGLGVIRVQAERGRELVPGFRQPAERGLFINPEDW